MSESPGTKSPEQIAELVWRKADELLAPVETTINRIFPTNELRRVMWIAVYERVRARIST